MWMVNLAAGWKNVPAQEQNVQSTCEQRQPNIFMIAQEAWLEDGRLCAAPSAVCVLAKPGNAPIKS